MEQAPPSGDRADEAKLRKFRHDPAHGSVSDSGETSYLAVGPLRPFRMAEQREQHLESACLKCASGTRAGARFLRQPLALDPNKQWGLIDVSVSRRVQEGHAPVLERLGHRRRHVVRNKQCWHVEAVDLMKDWTEGCGSEASFHFGCIGDRGFSLPDTDQRVGALAVEFRRKLGDPGPGMPMRSATVATTVCRSSFSARMSIIYDCPCYVDKCQWWTISGDAILTEAWPHRSKSASTKIRRVRELDVLELPTAAIARAQRADRATKNAA